MLSEWKKKKRSSPKEVPVLAYCERSGGRMDQDFANVETLFHHGREGAGPDLYLVAGREFAWLLQAGTHTIPVPSSEPGGYYVGLVPVGTPCKKVTTRGLKWDLGGQELAFGRLVSTSNGFAEGAEEVAVACDGPLLWTMTRD